MLDPAHTARVERRAAAREATRQGRRRLAALIAVVVVVLVVFLVSALGGSNSPRPRVANDRKTASSSPAAPVLDGGPLAPASFGGLAALWAPQNVVGAGPGTAAAYAAASKLSGLPGFLLIADRGNNRIVV